MKNREIPVYITFKVRDGFVQILIQRISYLLVEGNKIKLFSNEGFEFEVLEKMKDIDAYLKEYSFARIHQNCILNLNQELHFCAKDRTIILSSNYKLIVAKDCLNPL